MCLPVHQKIFVTAQIFCNTGEFLVKVILYECLASLQLFDLVIDVLISRRKTHPSSKRYLKLTNCDQLQQNE